MVRAFLLMLAWIVVIVGAGMTGIGIWFFGFQLDLGWAQWSVAVIWAFVCVFATSILWVFLLLGALIAEYIASRTLDQQERVLS